MTRKTSQQQYQVYSRGVNYCTPMGGTFDTYQEAIDAIPALMAAMIATIDPHAGGEHSAYFAPCTPSRANTITGRK